MEHNSSTFRVDISHADGGIVNINMYLCFIPVKPSHFFEELFLKSENVINFSQSENLSSPTIFIYHSHNSELERTYER
jgi:hypothetical protein